MSMEELSIQAFTTKYAIQDEQRPKHPLDIAALEPRIETVIINMTTIFAIIDFASSHFVGT